MTRSIIVRNSIEIHNGKLLFLARYCFTALVQRISDCGKIQNSSLIPDNVMNVSTYHHCAWMKSGRF